MNTDNVNNVFEDMDLSTNGLNKKQDAQIEEKTGFDITSWNQIINMQKTTNSEIDPEWEKKKLDWTTAMVVESSELIDSINWKWWKHMITDWDNIEIEMIDLLHFIFAKAIELKTESELYAIVIVKESSVQKMSRDKELSDYIINEVSQMLIPAILREDMIYTIMIWLDIWFKLGYTSNDIFKVYKMKNVLNKFRQNHNYKTGTYKKLWNGLEDNVYAQRVTKNIQYTNNFCDELYNELETIYSELDDKTIDNFVHSSDEWEFIMTKLSKQDRELFFKFATDFEKYKK